MASQAVQKAPLLNFPKLDSRIKRCAAQKKQNSQSLLINMSKPAEIGISSSPASAIKERSSEARNFQVANNPSYYIYNKLTTILSLVYEE